MPRTLCLLASLLLAAPALAGGLSERLLAVDASPSYLAERDALVLDSTVPSEALGALLSAPDWRVRQEAAVALGWRQHPALFTAVMQAQPMRDLADRLRFHVDAFSDPAAAPAILERLMHRGEAPALREGLLAALVDGPAGWEPALRGLLAEEPEPHLRVMIVGAMRKAADGEVARDVLRAGLSDPDPTVRAQAAESIGWRADGAALAPELVLALGDEDVAPRAMAARALGWLGVASAAPALAPLLSDAAADVRLHALRSLRRLDLPRARQLELLPALLRDPDPRVVKQARLVQSAP